MVPAIHAAATTEVVVSAGPSVAPSTFPPVAYIAAAPLAAAPLAAAPLAAASSAATSRSDASLAGVPLAVEIPLHLAAAFAAVNA